MKKRIFIISGLRTSELREENEEIAKIAEDIGFETYLSQRSLPYGIISDAIVIYKTNVKEIYNSDFIVVNANGLEYKDGRLLEGHGIEFEWGCAVGKKKPVIVYSRFDFPPFPAKFTASTKEELKQKLLLIKMGTS